MKMHALVRGSVEWSGPSWIPTAGGAARQPRPRPAACWDKKPRTRFRGEGLRTPKVCRQKLKVKYEPIKTELKRRNGPTTAKEHNNCALERQKMKDAKERRTQKDVLCMSLQQISQRPETEFSSWRGSVRRRRV